MYTLAVVVVPLVWFIVAILIDFELNKFPLGGPQLYTHHTMSCGVICSTCLHLLLLIHCVLFLILFVLTKGHSPNL
jgi:hypothetical protein